MNKSKVLPILSQNRFHFPQLFVCILKRHIAKCGPRASWPAAAAADLVPVVLSTATAMGRYLDIIYTEISTQTLPRYFHCLTLLRSRGRDTSSVGDAQLCPQHSERIQQGDQWWRWNKIIHTASFLEQKNIVSFEQNINPEAVQAFTFRLQIQIDKNIVNIVFRSKSEHLQWPSRHEGPGVGQRRMQFCTVANLSANSSPHTWDPSSRHSRGAPPAATRHGHPPARCAYQVRTICNIILHFIEHFPEIFIINNDNTPILYISSTLVKTCRKLASKYTSLTIIIITCLFAQATLTEPTRSSTCSPRCCRSASWPAPAPGDYSHDDDDGDNDNDYFRLSNNLCRRIEEFEHFERKDVVRWHLQPPISIHDIYQYPYTSPACVGERCPQRLRPAVPGLQERVSRGGGVPHLEVSTNHHYSARDVGIHHYSLLFPGAMPRLNRRVYLR